MDARQLDMQIPVETDDGKEVMCDALTIFPLNGRQYIALLPVGAKDTDDIWLYRFVPKGKQEFNIEGIESDEEFDAAAEVFEAMVENQELDTLFAGE